MNTSLFTTAYLVNLGQPWSTLVNLGQPWSTLVNLGKRSLQL
jgi:hypothetical protein